MQTGGGNSSRQACFSRQVLLVAELQWQRSCLERAVELKKCAQLSLGHTRHAACDDSRQRQPRGSQIYFWILGLLGSVPIPRFPVSASASAAAIRRWTASDCSMSSATPCLRFVSCHVARAPIQGTHKWISSVLAVVWQNVRVKRRVLLTCPSSL